MRDFFKAGISYFVKHLAMLIALVIVSFVFYFIFFLYNLPTEPIIYASVISLVVLIAIGFIRFFNFYRKHRVLRHAIDCFNSEFAKLPMAVGVIEQDYQELVQTLQQNRLELENEVMRRLSQSSDYYTMWAHQIKTPIAAMRLLLQFNRSEQNALLEAELFKIEQYVDMVLGYMRTDGDTSDYVIKSYALDPIIRSAIHKFARFFIQKRLTLEYDGTDISVLTDQKWLLFVIEQLISNAVKYTERGGIRITVEDELLRISDTGIGVRSEDIPRVFDRGYTGFNGRMDKRSTGIGLYLSRRVLTRLGHSISMESQIGVGTTVCIDLSREKTEHE